MSSLIRKSISKAVAGSGIYFREYITLRFSVANPTLDLVTSTGKVVVRSIYNGARKTVKYAEGLTDAQLQIQADANTEVMLVGVFKKVDVVVESDTVSHGLLSIFFKNQDFLEHLEIGNKSAIEPISEIDVTKLPSLKALYMSRTNIDNIDLSASINLEEFEEQGHTLSYVDFRSCKKLKSINKDTFQLKANTIYASDLPLLEFARFEGAFVDISNCPNYTSRVHVYNCDTLIADNNNFDFFDFSGNFVGDYVFRGRNHGSVAKSRITSSGIRSIQLTSDMAGTIEIYNCQALTKISIPNAADLVPSYNWTFTNIPNIEHIECRCAKEVQATSIAGLITASTVSNGHLYTKSSDAYFSQLQQAAVTKGWTIHELQ